MRSLLTLAVIFISAAIPAFTQSLRADLIITNANIRTMDAKRNVVRSLAVLDGRIVALGSDAELRGLVGTKTHVIDAGGKTVLPGFNDAHVHFLETGQQLSLVDLRTAKSPAEFVARLKAYAAKLPKGRWILGGRWDHENWTPAELPTAAMVDAAIPDHPVFVDRLDGHMALANSLAMKQANVTRETRDVVGGVIVRNADGIPTGIFKDAAMEMISTVIPPITFEQRMEAAKAATEHAASLGVTSVQDLGFSPDLVGVRGTESGAYQELHRRGELKTRIYLATPLTEWKRPASAGIRAAFGGPMLRIGLLKGYSDGSLGSKTAWLFEPYLDDPGNSGLAGEDMSKMTADVSAAESAGLQVAIHAIGDRANAEVLGIYAKSDVWGRRFRVEHAQHLRQQDISQFAKLGVVASMQPVHLPDDGRWAGKRLGKARLKGTYAFRSLLDTGAVLAFGSDSPVAPLNPLFGIYAAVTRRTTDDKNPGGWIPEQKITVDEAVRAFTFGSAYAEFQEDIKGTLEVGKLADIVILSDDIFTMAAENLANARVVITIVNGCVVFEAK